MEKQPLVFDKEVQIVLKALDMFFNRTNKSSREIKFDYWLMFIPLPKLIRNRKSTLR